ncbi:MAG: restriction endonuclease [Bacteroidetes bacterium]|jgi:hypothetical protein|nr:restriction endonuclease [Bacteroidota bacterium]
MELGRVRARYHRRIREQIIRRKTLREKVYYNFADSSNRGSISIAASIVRQIGGEEYEGHVVEQTVGGTFETLTSRFVQEGFNLLQHLRPGTWSYQTTKTDISAFAQYQHLAEVEDAIQHNPILSSIVGRDYIVTPDIVVLRSPLEDENIDAQQSVVGDDPVALRTLLRASNHPGKHPRQLLHASISCKWTIRSGRSQNARTEALNLIRNRKGRVPHIVAVTAEPLPTRIASIALGTGDLDCVYHFALHELERAVREVGNQDQQEMLDTLLTGDRLRDISDLPLDLAI